MKLQLWSIGKSHEDHVKEGIHLFTGRLKHYTDFELRIIAPPKNAGRLTASELRKKEAALILEQLQEGDFLIALDEKGTEFTTLQLADFLQQKTNAGVKRLVFLIGGAYGLEESIFKRAQQKISLSRLTFPHQLVRLIVTEQLYRACTILQNEKYHHQ